MLVFWRSAGIENKEGFTLEKDGEVLAWIGIAETRGRQARIMVDADDDVIILRDDAKLKVPKDEL